MTEEIDYDEEGMDEEDEGEAYPPPPHLIEYSPGATPPATDSEHINEDAMIMQQLLVNLYSRFAYAAKVDDVCKLSLTTIKLLEARRKLALRPYGAPTSPSGKTLSIETIE